MSQKNTRMDPDMILFTPYNLRFSLVILCIAFLLIGPVGAFTANSLEITVDKSGDGIAVFQFSLEGFLENAIPQSVLEEELLKGLGTSSEPPELIAMDRSSATIRMKKFADTSEVATGREYRTATMNFKKAEIALKESALSSVVSADFSPATAKVIFPDKFSRQFDNSDILPSITHIVIDLSKAVSAAAVQTPSPNGAIKVISSPEGVQVSIDGVAVGTAPATFSDIPAGSHTLRFSKENFEPVSKSVTVKAGQTIQVSAFLAYVEPTQKPVPGFTALFAGLALGLCILFRMRE